MAEIAHNAFVPKDCKLPTVESSRTAVERIVGKSFIVLDDGFVILRDVMGSDRAIVEAARVSYGSGTKHVSSGAELIAYLMRHGHTSPFEMVEFKFHVRVPMDTWRQWIRHRTANTNEYSTRYSEAIDSQRTTRPDGWRHQATNNKQGSSKQIVEHWPDDWSVELDPTMCKNLFSVPHVVQARTYLSAGAETTPGSYLTVREAALQRLARQVYRERLAFGVAREQARKDLPLSTYTEAYWKIDLHNLLHFLQLRLDPHAQLEIRQYAEAISSIVATICPVTWAAFLAYRLRAVTLTTNDQIIISRLARVGLASGPASLTAFYNVCAPMWPAVGPHRERDECLAKLQKIGLVECPPFGETDG